MELRSERTDEPLLISAPLEGLKRVISELAELRTARRRDALDTTDFEPYLEHSAKLDQVAEGMDSLIKHLKTQKRAALVILGDEAIAGRELITIGGGEKALGDPIIWPAASQQLITYSKKHKVDNCPDMMPAESAARYYSRDQLVVGNDSGVIPFFRLNDVHEQGGWVKIVPHHFDDQDQ